MMASVKARFSNGVLTPLEPLDLEDGAEVLVSVAAAPPPDPGARSVLDLFDKLHKSVPRSVGDDVPTDGAKQYKHYLYGWPKDAAP